MDPGKLELRVRCADGRIDRLSVNNSRPQAPQFLLGMPVAPAVALIPKLFALCGQAQGAAAMAARAAAEQGACTSMHDAGVAAEAAQEHLWRLLFDWPRELGLAPQDAAFVFWRRSLSADPAALMGQDFRDFLDRDLLGMTPEAWLGLSRADELEAWLRISSSPAARLCRALAAGDECADGSSPDALLPVLDANDAARDWPVLSAAFALQPQWRGQARETGAYARRHEDPLLTTLAAKPLLIRLLARMQELAALSLGDFALPLPGAVMTLPLEPGRGRVLVETARGLLIHELRLADGLVADYVIVAPTEWNFHPDGALSAMLIGCPCSSERQAESLARRAVLALDPCVATEITIDWQAST